MAKRGTKEWKEKISESLRGSKSPSWKGGRVNHKGYILIHHPHHPFANSQGYIFEHRLIMEKHIKRFLLPTEVIHHINEIRDDNKIENLLLLHNLGEHNKYHKRR